MACAALAPALWACTSHRLAVPDPEPAIVDTRMFVQNVNHKLDILFMVDDSNSMSPLQTKMSKQLGNFMDILVDPSTGQLPDLHVAVVSSSFGAGAWKVSGCEPDKSTGDDGGKFLQGPGGAGNGSCSMLHAGAKFLDTGDGVNTHPNYDDDIREAFKCMALLGESGCGFESQFKSVVYALEKSRDPKDPDNAGFLRDDAVLAIVMVTNEDDCSVADNSLLLTPNVTSAMDPAGVGALFNYRCNEFGHVCGGKALPHGYPDAIPADGITLTDCVSAEDNGPKTDDGVKNPEDGSADPTHGYLWPTVKYFTDYIKSLKPNHPNDILVAAIDGPSMPYRVVAAKNPFHEGETMPSVEHSCTYPTDDPTRPENADPGIRINQWVRSFDTNGITYPICQKDLQAAMEGIARKIHEKIGSSCVAGNPAWTENDAHVKVHNCTVERVVDGDKAGAKPTPLAECLPIATSATNPERPTNAPCFQLLPQHTDCTKDPAATATTLFRICENADCGPITASSEQKHASVACAQAAP